MGLPSPLPALNEDCRTFRVLAGMVWSLIVDCLWRGKQDSSPLCRCLDRFTASVNQGLSSAQDQSIIQVTLLELGQRTVVKQGYDSA